MDIAIHPIPLGPDRCYVVQGKGVIMIDGGSPKKGKKFRKSLDKISMKPEHIKPVVLTHGHWDHIGSAKEIKEMTGAKIAMHWLEKDYLEKPLKTLPPAVTHWGRLLIHIMSMFMPLVHFSSTHVDVTLEDEEFSLLDFGIPGKIIPTPGHSQGSVSVLLETGDAFVGDLAMNAFPLRFNPGLPIFAEDPQAVKDSWRVLLNKGATVIYPAHGDPFPAEIIRKLI